jgi:hypothetical protein
MIFSDREFVKATFTPAEIDTILDPYHKFLVALPGYVSSATNIDGNTMTVTHTFDTMEHATNAKEQLNDNVTSPIVLANRDLMQTIRTRLGINYTYSAQVTE